MPTFVVEELAEPGNETGATAFTAGNGEKSCIYPKVKDLPKFYASGKDDVDDWINSITAIYVQMGQDTKEILSVLPTVRKGGAFAWFNNLTATERAGLVTWNDWCDEFRDAFRSANYEVKKSNELRYRTLRFNESFTDYYDARTKLQKVVMPNASVPECINDLLMGMPLDMHAPLKTSVQALGSELKRLTQFRRILIDLEPSLTKNRPKADNSGNGQRLGGGNKGTFARDRSETRDRSEQRDKAEPSDTNRAAQGSRSGYRSDSKDTKDKSSKGAQSSGKSKYYGSGRKQGKVQTATVHDESDSDSSYYDDQSSSEYSDEAFDDEPEVHIAEAYVTTRSRTAASRQSTPISQNVPDDESLQPSGNDSDGSSKTVRAKTSSKKRTSITTSSSLRKNSAQTELVDESNSLSTRVRNIEGSVKAPVRVDPSIEAMTFAEKTPAYFEAKLEVAGVQKSARICADTGASLSMVDERFVRRHLRTATLHDSEIIGIKGIGGNSVITKYLVAQVIVQDVKGHEVAVPVRLFVNPAEDSRVVLGNDFMIHYGGIVDLQNRTFSLTKGFEGAPVITRLDVRRDGPATVRSADCFTVKPYHTALIPVRLHGRVHTKCYYIDPVPLRNGKVAASIARTVARTGTGMQPVEIYNIDPFPLTIQAGEILGSAIPLIDRSAQHGDTDVFTANTDAKMDRRDRAEFAAALQDLSR